MNKIKIAVIGCGRIATRHFEAIQKHSNCMELVAICDIDQKALDKYTTDLGVDGYISMLDMLNGVDIDIVSLCTPSGLHPDQAVLAAEHGVHVITEKPMATRWNDGLRMVRACDNGGVRLFVVKQNRKNGTLQLLKRALDEDRFGKVHMVNLNVFWTRPQAYYDSAEWRGTWELDGGAFMNQASHYIDLINWLIGPVDSVQAMTATLMRDIEVEDTGVMNIRWRNGTLGSMSVTMLSYPENYEGSVTIIGEKGTVRVGGVSANKIEYWNFEDKKDYDKEVQNVSYDTTSVYGFGHLLYYENVINVLHGKADPEVDGRKGLKSLEVLIAAYLSARDGCTISLPLEY